MIEIIPGYWINPTQVLAVYEDEIDKGEIVLSFLGDYCIKNIKPEPGYTVEQTIRGIVDKINKNL